MGSKQIKSEVGTNIKQENENFIKQIFNFLVQNYILLFSTEL